LNNYLKIAIIITEGRPSNDCERKKTIQKKIKWQEERYSRLLLLLVISEELPLKPSWVFLTERSSLTNIWGKMRTGMAHRLIYAVDE